MENFTLHPTDTSQWYALVNEAEVSASKALGEELESYLVYMLMRYTKQPQLANKPLAMAFLEGQHVSGQQRQLILRDVGDQCLLFSGLFPGRAEKQSLKVSYFVQLGQIAYGTLSTQVNQKLAELFASLHQDFVAVMDVLQAMRASNGMQSAMKPLQAVDLWSETGSTEALNALKAQTKGGTLILQNRKVIQ